MNACREAFDLFHPGCRRNFIDVFRHKWDKRKWRLWWWRMVLSDTRNRICSRRKP